MYSNSKNKKKKLQFHAVIRAFSKNKK